jgi:hypothetical protein
MGNVLGYKLRQIRSWRIVVELKIIQSHGERIKRSVNLVFYGEGVGLAVEIESK